MTIPSKTVGILSVVSCLHDIHKTSLITSEEARQKAYENVDKIEFEGENHRHDIGLDLLS